MEVVDALLKTDNVALVMALAWILYMHKQVAKATDVADKERAKNERLIELIRTIADGQKSHAAAIRQIRRLLVQRAGELDETGEFNAADFPAIS
jgi:hypothetical protein